MTATELIEALGRCGVRLRAAGDHLERSGAVPVRLRRLLDAIEAEVVAALRERGTPPALPPAPAPPPPAPPPPRPAHLDPDYCMARLPLGFGLRRRPPGEW